jgi:serine/threonine protein kinase
MWWKSVNLRDVVGSEYTRLKYLGNGLNGVVYRAFVRSSRKPVAIKFVNVAPKDRTTRKRLAAEVAAMQKLDGASAVKLFEANTSTDPPYYVMEFLKLGDFRSRLQRPISPLALLSLFSKICQCVAQCHGAEITHRDIKPENILFRSSTKPVLADFGVCKIQSADLGTMVVEMEKRGTPLYMAPEQLKDYLPQSKPADIYALGTMLHFDVAAKLSNPMLIERTEKLAEGCRAPNPSRRPDIQALINEIGALIAVVQDLQGKKAEIGRLINVVDGFVKRVADGTPEVARTEGLYLRDRMLEFNELVGDFGKYVTSERWYLPEVPPYYEPHFDSEKLGVKPEQQKRLGVAEARRFARHMRLRRRELR